MGAVLRFVDSIQASPTVRLDLNDTAQTWVATDETKFPPPPLKRSVTSSMLRDGSPPTASAYDNREITLVLTLSSALTDNAAATQLQALYRELDRPTNLLQYIPGSVTNPVFFRTFRTSPDDVLFDPLLKQVRVTVLAEPFAVGVRVDVGPTTVNNNPAAGSNGLFLDLTGIKGDVETPLFIEYADGAGGLARSVFAIGVRTGAAPYPNRFLQAESMSLASASDMSVVADAAMSGGSKARCTFATVPGMGVRVSSKFPNPTLPAGAENWGVYRVYARVAQTVATDVISMKAGAASSNTDVTIRSQTAPQLVDLGTLDSTFGSVTTGGHGVAEYRVEDMVSPMLISAARLSGSGSLDIDYIVFVPADECFGSWISALTAPGATYLWVIDGVSDAAYIATALSGATPGKWGLGGGAITGRLPRVMPGDNRLVIVETASPSLTNAITTSISMTIRYWPLYLQVRPLTT